MLLEEARAAAGRARRGDRFETFAAISRELSSTIKIDEMLEKMVDHTCEIVPVRPLRAVHRRRRPARR